MTQTIRQSTARVFVCCLGLLLTSLVLASIVSPARGAEVIREGSIESRGEPPGARGPRRTVVVEPGPHWDGLDEFYGGACDDLRIKMWIDRGAWSTYRPGDLMWIYFRVNRPCYVTIVDRSPDGRIQTVFPNRWSGSNFVYPGSVYCVPDSRRFSLRVAGPRGVETLTACAHRPSWSGGPPCGAWFGRSPSPWGAFRFGASGGSRRPHDAGAGSGIVVLPGSRPKPEYRPRVPGRGIVVRPRAAHPLFSYRYCHARDSASDSVSFYVVAAGGWDGRTHLRDDVTMRRCTDRFVRDVFHGGRSGVLRIECAEAERGRPTRIEGTLTLDQGWGTEAVFRIDVDGRDGVRPWVGQTFVADVGPFIVEVDVTDLRFEGRREGCPPAIALIRFHVRVLGLK